MAKDTDKLGNWPCKDRHECFEVFKRQPSSDTLAVSQGPTCNSIHDKLETGPKSTTVNQ